MPNRPSSNRGNGATATAKSASRAGRPTLERVAAIDESVLDAARGHFLDAGFESTSMETVAATAGVSKSTLYARYPTKTALLRAVVTEQIKAWTARHVRRGPLPADFKQRLHVLARGVLAAMMAKESQPFHRLAHRAVLDEWEFSHALYELALLPAIAELTEEILQGSRDFTMPPLNPEHVARMIHAMLYGWWAEREAAGGATVQEANAFADRSIDILFYGRAAW